MTKIILSTSNIINGGPSIIRRPTVEKSNVELITSLRASISAYQEAAHDAISAVVDGESTQKNNGTSPRRPPPSLWTSWEDSTLYVPAIDWTLSGLAEERSQYDITVKLFYLPDVCPKRRCAQTKEAVALVLKELKVPSIDLLILSFPGVTFDPDPEEESVGRGGCGGGSSDGASTTSGSADTTDVEELDSMVKTWTAAEELHAKGIISKLGVSEFGNERLAEFLKRVHVRPSVNQINVRDCCTVPRSLIEYAKQEHIQLLTHNDCTNILPEGTVRELLGQGETGAGLLTDHGGKDGAGLTGDIEPQWVVKYTAVVKDRGVVEYKGYFAVADLKD
ncbi:MAG: hypothetical protein M1816_001787 [Peltula sp. TS41687]|nr:MAG: hypothetical protein M1816_001787 [Peltula sp. TS41687]